MCSNGLKVSFSEDQVDISDIAKGIAAGLKRGFMYVLNIVMPEHALYASLKTWLARHGHLPPKENLQMSSDNVAENL